MVEAAQARTAADSLSAALEQSDFVGWDPYDALASPAIRAVARAPILRQAVIQGLKVLPVNPRRVLGVPAKENAKALALFVSAYARLARLEPDSRFAGLALALAERLERRALPSGDGAGWSYPFDVQTRWGYYPSTQPNAVVTSFAAHALMDVEDLAPPGRFSPAVDAALAYARSRLLVEEGEDAFFAYYHGSRVPVHNASLLVASVFTGAARRPRRLPRFATRFPASGRTGRGLRRAARARLGRRVHRRSSSGVLGSWAKERRSPLRSTSSSRAWSIRTAPSVPTGSRYPVDIHSCASSIWALSDLHERDPRALEGAGRILDWTLANMRRDDGRFAFQKRRLFRASVPYARWSDGHMLLALSEYLTATTDG